MNKNILFKFHGTIERHIPSEEKENIKYYLI